MVVTLAVAMVAGPAAADPAPPSVLVLAERAAPGINDLSLAVIAPDGSRRAMLDALPLASYALAAHAATGRWVLTFHQLPDGDPLVIAGAPVSKPNHRSTLVFGDGTGVVATTLGDPACTSKQRACFETPRWFSTDGGYVFVRSEASSWTSLGRWTFGAGAKRAAIADRTTAAELEVAPAGGRAVYRGRDGVHVTTWPTQPTGRRARAIKVPVARRATFDPQLLMSSVWPIGDRLYYFRRDPDHQEVGWYESYRLTDRTTVALRQAAAAFPMMRGQFLSTGPRATVVFADDVGYERAQVYEVGADGAVTAVVADVCQVLDVSPDGRYLLVTRRLDPRQGETGTNPERLVIVDLTTRAEVATLDVGVSSLRVNAASFVVR